MGDPWKPSNQSQKQLAKAKQSAVDCCLAARLTRIRQMVLDDEGFS
jgi:hypothetical protein